MSMRAARRAASVAPNSLATPYSVATKSTSARGAVTQPTCGTMREIVPPRAVAVRTREQRNRWRRLTGEALPLAPEGPG